MENKLALMPPPPPPPPPPAPGGTGLTAAGGRREWWRWLLGLAMVLASGLPAAAQSLTALQLQAFTPGTTSPPSPTLWTEPTFSPFPQYIGIRITTPFLLGETTSQSLSYTGKHNEHHTYVCTDKSVDGSWSDMRRHSHCGGQRVRLGSGSAGTYSLTVTQAMINNGGIVVATRWREGGAEPIVSQWVPIYNNLSTLTLAPAFAAATGSYTAYILPTASRLRVTPTGSGTITVRVNGGSPTTVTSGATHTVTSLNTGANTVTITAASGGNTKTYTVNVRRVTAALSLTPPSISENGGVSTVTATLSGPSSEATTLTVSAVALSPAVSGDFTLSTANTLTIAAGATTSTGTVTVTANDNAVGSPDKSVVVSATAAGGNGVANPSGVTLTLRNDDYGLDVGAVSGQATEGGGQAMFPVALLTRPTAAVTVAVSGRDTGEGLVSAGGGAPAASTTLTFAPAAWSTAQTVTVTGVDDDVDDGTVTWQVRLDPSSGDTDYDGLDAEDVDVTTTDDDGPPTVTLALDPSSIAESGTGNVATVTARLSHPSGAATTVTVAAGTAWAAGADAAIVIAAGATTAASDTATVVAADNTTDEPDRTGTVTATLTNARATADGTTMAVTGAALTVRDDDPAPTAALSLNPASVSESGGIATMTATLSRPSSEPSTVTVSAVSGSYTVGTDATITIAAGATTAASDTVLVTAVDDAVHQGSANRSATVTATLANGQGAGTVSAATLTLTDDEALPTVALVLPTSVSENGGIATVTATLSGASTAAVTLTVATAAVSPAVQGDFTRTGSTLTIAAGSTTSVGTVTVTAVDNAVDAADKQVTVTATAAGGHGVANPANATLTLTDDEATATAALVLTPASISESGGISTVTATLSHPTTEAVTLSVSATAVSPAPGTGGFTLSATTTLTLAAGTTTSTGTVTVTAVNNNVASGSQQVRVSATAAGGRGVAAPSAVTLALRDDDYGLVESAVSGQATEGGGQATFTVRLRSQPSEAVTVTVTSRDTTEGRVSAGGGAPAASTTLTFTTGSWSTAQTVTVTGVDDAIDDGTVTWTVRLAPSSGDTSYDNLAAVDVPVTTTDDDTARATLVLTPASILENGEVSTVTATLSHATTEAVTLTVAAAAGTGAAATDFTLSTTTTLTLAAGATTSTGLVTVTANDNTVASADKQVTVSATASGGRGMAAPADVTLTLRDDEATADVNGDGSIGPLDGLLMYYAYTFETVFKLENDLGQRVRGFLRTLRGAGSPAADDAGYKAMLQATPGTGGAPAPPRAT